MTRSSLLLIPAILAAGCRRSAPPPNRQPEGRQALPQAQHGAAVALSEALGADTMPALDTVTITKPTLIAGSSFSQSEVDSGDAAEAQSDFVWYLSGVEDSLAKRGVQFADLGVQRALIRSGTISYIWSLRADSERIGYLLAMPGDTPAVRYGVMTTDMLLGWVDSTLARIRPRVPR